MDAVEGEAQRVAAVVLVDEGDVRVVRTQAAELSAHSPPLGSSGVDVRHPDAAAAEAFVVADAVEFPIETGGTDLQHVSRGRSEVLCVEEDGGLPGDAGAEVVGDAFAMIDHQTQPVAPERRLQQLTAVAGGQAFEPENEVGVHRVAHVASRPVR